MPVAVVLMTHGHHVGYGILLFCSLAFLAWSLLPMFFNHRKDSKK
jgi:hypothetical protein